MLLEKKIGKEIFDTVKAFGKFEKYSPNKTTYLQFEFYENKMIVYVGSIIALAKIEYIIDTNITGNYYTWGHKLINKVKVNKNSTYEIEVKNDTAVFIVDGKILFTAESCGLTNLNTAYNNIIFIPGNIIDDGQSFLDGLRVVVKDMNTVETTISTNDEITITSIDKKPTFLLAFSYMFSTINDPKNKVKTIRLNTLKIIYNILKLFNINNLSISLTTLLKKGDNPDIVVFSSDNITIIAI